MPRPRIPRMRADITGYFSNHPERFRTGGNHPPAFSDPIGDRPEWLAAQAQDAWLEFADTLPWLNRSHRGHLAITSLLAGKLRSGELGTSGMNLLRLCLGQLGATPADFLKVGWTPDVEEDDDDLGDEFFV